MIYRIEQYFPIYEQWREIGCANSKCVALQGIFEVKKKHPKIKYRIVELIDTF